MTYAVIRLGGKQFMVEKGDKFELERQENPLNVDVLYYTDGKDILVGDPVVSKVEVKAKVVEDKKGEKIRVGRFKSKSRYRRVKGHRQPLSVIEIEDIVVEGVKKAEDKKEEKPIEKTETKASQKSGTKQKTKSKRTKKEDNKKETKKTAKKDEKTEAKKKGASKK